MELKRVGPYCYKIVTRTKKQKKYKIYKDYTNAKQSKPTDIVDSKWFYNKEVFFTNDYRCYFYHTRHFHWKEMKRGGLSLVINSKVVHISMPRLFYSYYYPHFDPFDMTVSVRKIDKNRPLCKDNLKLTKYKIIK